MVGTEAPAQVAHGKTHCRLHVLDLEREQTRGRGAVPRQPQRQHVQPLAREGLGQRVHAVRRIREPMQQQHGRRRVRRRVLPGAVPVDRPGRGIAPAAAEIAVERQAVLGLRLGVHLAIELGEEPRLERAVVCDRAHLVGPRRGELLVEMRAMPGLELGSAAQKRM